MSDVDFSRIAVAAETHPPAYSFHKYWARKPHNVVRRVLQACGVAPGTLVIDPFCGSGVPLSEAAALGAECIGFDVNPVAVALAGATLAPPDPADFHAAFSAILNAASERFSHRYTQGGRKVRYVVHATTVVCETCQTRVSADAASRRGRRYTCPRCQSGLSFNLENLVATRVLHPKWAVAWAAFFNFAAAFTFGVAVAKTVGSGVVEASSSAMLAGPPASRGRPLRSIR